MYLMDTDFNKKMFLYLCVLFFSGGEKKNGLYYSLIIRKYAWTNIHWRWQIGKDIGVDPNIFHIGHRLVLVEELEGALKEPWRSGEHLAAYKLKDL